ncbi:MULTISPECIES: flagellar basal body-associated protein FliL [Sporosarcina]|uniref:Flagellar protein FliL n=1 Tax=Sporosarcina ureae TaxID=1571 RepID=A0ABM6JYP1_SPOUR|nr:MULTISPECIES: flagellar basal body-associated protein FliL [Sporosarcina]ARF15325.1 flagellar basal body-associated protein FliL [Sporosarcina ureae]ARF18458.1 flagellar basal body-associated protein FliL [Sporosarcina ureae]PIC58785.1 flagellar basal body-associated protein FliL [Sporosarcina sp. P10]PIC62105.1 flagellar basal body-associated protein FliL [Sporosarcina sp. P12(2017)]PIC78247.1 flagellar basal body-associated protein FliL [Sporosarcina sp. P19]
MKNKLLTISLIILVSITLIGVVAVVLILNFNKDSDGEEKAPSIDEIIESSVDMEEITTNLSGRNFVRISLKIQTDSKKAAEELTKRDFQVKNLAIQELSEMTTKDLEGKAGKQQFEDTIKAKLNELMQDGEIQKVYIVSYIIQ